MCNVNKFSCFSFSNKGFIGILKENKDLQVKSANFMEELLERINKSIVDDAVTEILREERYNLRREKKRPWSSRRTRAPFYYRAKGKSKSFSFKAALYLAELVVNKLGPPWKNAKTGRPPWFCSKKLASVLLVKHYSGFSFESLKAKLIEIGFDCRRNTKNKKDSKIPSKSELHWALKKIKLKYLEEALRLLDDCCAQIHEKMFGKDGLNKFGVDGTESTCVEFEEHYHGFEKHLKLTNHKVHALVRLVTNSFCEVSTSKKENLRDLTVLLKKRKISKRSISNLEIYGDAFYDSEKNYEFVFYNNSELIVRPNIAGKTKIRGFFRKKAHENFSKRRYKIRKITERPFGNTTLRDGNKIWYKRSDMKQKGELLRCITHNIKTYFMQESWTRVFLKFPKHQKILQVMKSTK